ncbi:MAG: pyrroline-5-carboxylate reductase [Acidobacteriota bacterium]|jgi:pyrroline-5-carboxylate reductase|nr:pyrroline-5-carboxylate reductase [Acidobacteriota bacterium]
MLKDKTVGFVGAGNMGGAILRGLLQSGRVDKSQIVVSDIDAGKLSALQAGCGIQAAASNAEVVRRADIVILGVKPYHVDALLDEVAADSREGQTFVSIIAGAPVGKFSAELHPKAGVVRVMPNTPAAVLAGAAAIYAGGGVSPDALAEVVEIFEGAGRAVVVQDEALMDAVTGLSGSGPAYVFLAIEALGDAGVQLGIARKEAVLLAAQTVYGAAKMMLETGKSPAELKDMVTTPGGTTAAGLRMLEKGRFRAVLADAVDAAASRSRELCAPRKP